MTVQELIDILQTLPPDTEIMQAVSWEQTAKPIESVDDLGWHFNNYLELSWCQNQLLVPCSQYLYYPTFKRVVTSQISA